MNVKRSFSTVEIPGDLDINPSPFLEAIHVLDFVEISYESTRYTGVIEAITNSGFAFAILPTKPPFISGDLFEINHDHIFSKSDDQRQVN